MLEVAIKNVFFTCNIYLYISAILEDLSPFFECTKWNLCTKDTKDIIFNNCKLLNNLLFKMHT